MKVYKVTPCKDLNTCCEKDINSVMACIMAWIEDPQAGDPLTIEIIEMSENEDNSLPEYMGP